MKSNLKSRLFQSTCLQHNEDYFSRYDPELIRPDPNGRIPVNENNENMIRELGDVVKGVDYAIKDQQKEKAFKDSLPNPFIKIPVDEQLQLYLDGYN